MGFVAGAKLVLCVVRHVGATQDLDSWGYREQLRTRVRTGIVAPVRNELPMESQ